MTFSKTYKWRLKKRLPSRCIVDEDGCWLWQGSLHTRGQPVMRHHDKYYYVSRVVAMLYLGMEIDSELCVLHKCDVQRCINPDHLYLGTQQDNMRDRWHGHVGNV